MTFRVGQKVVCIDNGGSDYRHWVDADVPEVGAIYTVIRIFDDLDPMNGDLLALELVEIKNNKTWSYGYAARRFRPIVERKTDISIFTSMLNPSKKRIDA